LLKADKTDRQNGRTGDRGQEAGTACQGYFALEFPSSCHHLAARRRDGYSLSHELLG
jgi:hypothetical protein